MDVNKMAQQVGANGAKVDAAHERLDRLELEIREDLRGVYDKLDEINKRLNKNSGFASGVLLLSGLVGAAIAKILELFFYHR